MRNSIVGELHLTTLIKLYTDENALRDGVDLKN
jgi:hypothetical protein